MEKTALKYIENHDHARFVCNFGTTPPEIEEPLRKLSEVNNGLCRELAKYIVVLKDRDLAYWYKVQPYLIAILMAKGIPMLWQGQEFGENYHIPKDRWGRVKMMRPVCWDFYSDRGRPIISLVRRLIRLRRDRKQLRAGDHFFYNNNDLYQSKGIVLFSRKYQDNFSLTALNFSDQDQTVPFVFPIDRDYIEELHGKEVDSLNLKNVVSGIKTKFLCPATTDAYGQFNL